MFQRLTKQHVPEIHALFNGDDFWKMYKLLRDMRHTTAHRGPLTQEVVYTGEDNFTPEQIDARAQELGYFEDAGFFKGSLRDHVIAMARYKAKLDLLGPPLKHVVFVQHQDGSGTFYNPDPHADLDRFLAFFHRVVDEIKPWDKKRTPPDEIVIARWKADIDAVGVDINNTWTVWEHFKVVYTAGMSNPRVAGHPSAIYMFVFITKAIVEWVILGVRRQVDANARSQSLFNFLMELKGNPTVYGLEKCLDTFRARAALLSTEWKERYEKQGAAAFAEVADASGLYMSIEEISADIKGLKKSCNALVNVANQYIAHKSKEGAEPELPAEKIDAVIAQIYSLTRKYGRLLDAFGVGPNGVDEESMRDLFSFPWVEPDHPGSEPPVREATK